MIQTSYKQSFKSSVSFDGFPQFPAQKQVPLQLLPSPQFLAFDQPASVSQQMTQSYAASSSWKRLYPKQPLPVPPQSGVKEVGSLPFQQGYPQQPDPVHRIHQRQPESNHLVQHAAATPYPAYHSLPPVNPVEPDIHQLPAADSRRLTDEFPFSYSIAKELPHIFGNLLEDKILDLPLTPSFEPPTEHDPLWDSLTLESDLSNAEFFDCVSPDYRRVQLNGFNSCCFGNGDLSSSPPLGELSRGFISKGRSFRFCRQD